MCAWQIVRTDLKELLEIPLGGAPYAYTPFCDSRPDMAGFRYALILYKLLRTNNYLVTIIFTKLCGIQGGCVWEWADGIFALLWAVRNNNNAWLYFNFSGLAIMFDNMFLPFMYPLIPLKLGSGIQGIGRITLATGGTISVRSTWLIYCGFDSWLLGIVWEANTRPSLKIPTVWQTSTRICRTTWSMLCPFTLFLRYCRLPWQPAYCKNTTIVCGVCIHVACTLLSRSAGHSSQGV